MQNQCHHKCSTGDTESATWHKALMLLQVNVVPQLTAEDVGAYKAWSGNGAGQKGNPVMYTSPGLAN